jgi:hypothetical protein
MIGAHPANTAASKTRLCRTIAVLLARAERELLEDDYCNHGTRDCVTTSYCCGGSTDESNAFQYCGIQSG